MSLVDSDFTLGGHVVEPLLRVDTGFERCGPRSGVHSSTPLVGVREVLPVDQEGNGIFGLGVTTHGGGNTGGS